LNIAHYQAYTQKQQPNKKNDTLLSFLMYNFYYYFDTSTTVWDGCLKCYLPSTIAPYVAAILVVAGVLIFFAFVLYSKLAYLNA